MTKPANTLRHVAHTLTRLLDTADLGEATESVDRALDQIGYALEELNEPTVSEDATETEDEE